MKMDFLHAKSDFLAAAKRVYESGIQTGTGGNLSVRIPECEQMIVKPSGFSYGACSEENLTITDFSGNLVEGAFKPTRESTLHGNLYRRYPHIGGIVHTHSPFAILASLYYDEIPLPTMHTKLKLKSNIPVAAVSTQAVEESELPKIFSFLDENPELQAFILRGHGIVTLGKSAVAAGQTAELIEETAQIFWEKEKMDLLLRLTKEQ